MRPRHIFRHEATEEACGENVVALAIHTALENVGHLALFEMTSSIPNRRYGDGLRRLGYDGAATEFFDEHVLADAVHENIADVDLAGGLASQRPDLSSQILWGARALVFCEGRWAAHLLEAWESGRSSLLAQPALTA